MDKLQTITAAISKLGMTAKQNGDTVFVYDKRGRLAGTVSADGTVDRKYDGRQALMGAIVRDTIVAALAAAREVA